MSNNYKSNHLHPAGSYAGFVVSEGLLSLLGGVTVTVYNDDTSDSQSVSGAGLLGLSLGGTAKVGFYPTIDFNRIRVTFGGVALGSRSVYYAEILTPDDTEAPNLGEESCNLSIPWVQSDGSVDGEGFPVVIELERTGADGVSLSDITGLDNVVRSEEHTSANMYQILNLLGASSSISVRTDRKSVV